MSDIPTLLKILRYLRSNVAPVTCDDIISTVHEGQAMVDKALDKLVAEVIVENNDGYYRYVDTPRAEELCQKMFALYEKLIMRSQLELLARGLLCRAGGYRLIRLNTFLQALKVEGFAFENVTQFLDAEIKKGYVMRVPGDLVANVPIRPPLSIPHYYTSREVSVCEYQQIKEWFHDVELPDSEKEDYLIGDYPPELAEPAIRHMETERRELRQTLEKQAFHQW